MAKYGYANRIGYVKKNANKIMRKKCKIAVGEKKLKMVTRKINNQMN